MAYDIDVWGAVAEKNAHYTREMYGTKVTADLRHTLRRCWAGVARPMEIRRAMCKAQQAYRSYMAQKAA